MDESRSRRRDPTFRHVLDRRRDGHNFTTPSDVQRNNPTTIRVVGELDDVSTVHTHSTIRSVSAWVDVTTSRQHGPTGGLALCGERHGQQRSDGSVEKRKMKVEMNAASGNRSGHSKLAGESSREPPDRDGWWPRELEPAEHAPGGTGPDWMGPRVAGRMAGVLGVAPRPARHRAHSDCLRDGSGARVHRSARRDWPIAIVVLCSALRSTAILAPSPWLCAVVLAR